MSATFQRVPMGEVATFKTGKLDSNAAVENGAYPFFTCSRDTFRTNTYSFDDEVVLLAGNNANGIYPLKYFKGKFDAYQRTYVIRPIDESRLDTRFLYFALRPQLDHLRSVSTGSATKFLTMGLLSNLELPLPDLPTQRKIAGILSAYDDLIENNLRRIKILEQMAQSLYREWFVHFRFPGHESARFIDSSLGQIPKGWEVKTIADICQSVSYGFTASASRENIGPKFLRITDIVPDQIDWENVPFCEIPEDKVAKLLLLPGDIVIARTGATTGYAKRLNKLHPDTVFASYLVRARAKDTVSNRMLGILMESDDYKKFIQTNLSGSAQPQANAVVLTSMPLVVPDGVTLEGFDRFVEPMIDEAELLTVKIQTLRRTRDLLLPKLLSPS